MKYIANIREFNGHSGNKTKGIKEAAQLGFRIPEGFIVSAETYDYYKESLSLPKDFSFELSSNIEKLGEIVGKVFGSTNYYPPLLVSVRCGEKRQEDYLPQSLINIGLPASYDENNEFLSSLDSNRRMMLDMLVSNTQDDISYFCDLEPIEQIEQLIIFIYKRFIATESEGLAISDHSLLIQQMVYGDLNSFSVSGSAYTRNPYTLAEEDYGKYIKKSGHFINFIETDKKNDLSELKIEMPRVYYELKGIFSTLEEHYKEARYVEYIIEDGQVYILQNSSGKYLVPRVEAKS